MPRRKQANTNKHLERLALLDVDSNNGAAASEEVQPSTDSQPVKPRKKYYASIYPGPDVPLDDLVATTLLKLEETLGIPLWFLIQSGELLANEGLPDVERSWDFLGNQVADAFFALRSDLPRNGQVALLVHSGGGDAQGAYRIATLLRRQCEGFTAIVPRYAKSAATLLCLGAEEIILGSAGELGPLDVQIVDHEREDTISALDEVQALERLHAIAMDSLDRMMYLLSRGTKKKASTLLPLTLHFTSEFMRPLLEKIDTVHYTQMSRALKVGEEYAIRLLQPKYPEKIAKEIARLLVEKYPEHGFVIDAQEAEALGLKVTESSLQQDRIMDVMLMYLDRKTLIGRLIEAKEENGENTPQAT